MSDQESYDEGYNDRLPEIGTLNDRVTTLERALDKYGQCRERCSSRHWVVDAKCNCGYRFASGLDSEPPS